MVICKLCKFYKYDDFRFSFSHQCYSPHNKYKDPITGDFMVSVADCRDRNSDGECKLYEKRSVFLFGSS